MAEEPKGTLVRGADGALYLITQGSAPVKLDDKEADKVTKILADAKGKLEKILNEDLSKVAAGCNQNIQITIPDVPMK
jgi:hypothetical protein